MNLLCYKIKIHLYFQEGVRIVNSFAGKKMSGEELEIKTERIFTVEDWRQKNLEIPNQHNVKK